MKDDMKSHISRALEELLQNKDLDKITVRELVDSCNISRQSFYNHFQDIVEIFEWQSSLESEKNLDGEPQSIEEPLVRFLKTTQEHFTVFNNMLNSEKMRDPMIKIIIGIIREHLRPLLQNHEEGAREFLLILLSYGTAGILIEQVGRPDFKPERVAHEIRRLLDARMA